MPDYRTSDGDVLDRVCWKHYGRAEGAVEAVLEANPHLADLGASYAAGVVLTLPELAPEDAEAVSEGLWD